MLFPIDTTESETTIKELENALNTPNEQVDLDQFMALAERAEKVLLAEYTSDKYDYFNDRIGVKLADLLDLIEIEI